MHARIQIYWCRSSIFRHLKLELLTQFPASNDEKYINVVYIWRKFVSFYGYVHWRMTTEISVMYGSEKVKSLTLKDHFWNYKIAENWIVWNQVSISRPDTVSSFSFISILMLSVVMGLQPLFYSFSAGIDFSQNLTTKTSDNNVSITNIKKSNQHN